MFAPKILASVPELAEYYQKDLARLRVIARDTAVVIELWIRSRHKKKFIPSTEPAGSRSFFSGNDRKDPRRGTGPAPDIHGDDIEGCPG
jgi:hypothetical protein